MSVSLDRPEGERSLVGKMACRVKSSPVDMQDPLPGDGERKGGGALQEVRKPWVSGVSERERKKTQVGCERWACDRPSKCTSSQLRPKSARRAVGWR